tara:strand:- start:62 stop:250 length:189 start_codon:yes stop_codon:yes gene_type:complete
MKPLRDPGLHFSRQVDLTSSCLGADDLCKDYWVSSENHDLTQFIQRRTMELRKYTFSEEMLH